MDLLVLAIGVFPFHFGQFFRYTQCIAAHIHTHSVGGCYSCLKFILRAEGEGGGGMGGGGERERRGMPYPSYYCFVGLLVF